MTKFGYPFWLWILPLITYKDSDFTTWTGACGYTVVGFGKEFRNVTKKYNSGSFSSIIIKPLSLNCYSFSCYLLDFPIVTSYTGYIEQLTSRADSIYNL